MRRSFRAALAMLSFSIGSAAASLAATASLVADLNAGEPLTEFPGKGPSQFVAVNGKAVFLAQEPSSGEEPWVTDGTPHGTQLLRDLCPGTCQSAPILLGSTGTMAFLFAYSGSSQELWRTDGTRAGTVRLTDADAVRLHGIPDYVLTDHALFFSACDGETGCEPWFSDGTVAGTRRVADLNPGGVASNSTAFRALGDTAYFIAYTPSGGDLWRSDGTAAGTWKLHPGVGGSSSFGANLTAADGRLYFVAAENGAELWTSDGTPQGTRALTSFTAANPFFGAFEASGELLHFVVDDIVGGSDLWQSDGTRNGTHRVTNFGFADPFGFNFRAANMERLGGHVLFAASDGLTGTRLWSSDGNPASARPLGDCPQTCLEGSFESIPLWRVGERVLFLADNGGATALWSSDGTVAGTQEVRELCPGDCAPYRPQGEVAGGALYFVTYTYGSENGSRLWRSDGTPAGTRVVLDVTGAEIGTQSEIEVTATAAGTFFAVSDVHGNQLWRIDGATTERIAEFSPGAASSDPTGLQPFGGELLFRACDGDSAALWASGGTAASTHQLPGPWFACGAEYGPRGTTVVGNLAFFVHQDLATGSTKLWRTDGSGAGTFEVATFDTREVGPPAVYQGKLLFAVKSFDRAALWSSDGTVAGTHEVVGLPDAVRGVSYLTATGEDAYFVGTPAGIYGAQAWRTDGTPAGTRQVSSFSSYSFNSPAEFTRLGSAVYFLASTDSNTGAELWRTTGTLASTALVVPHTPEARAEDAQGLVVFQGKLHFFGILGTGDNARGLWRSDGTAAGTVAVAPIAPTLDYSITRAAIEVGDGAMFFVADDGEHGNELWRSDGTTAGTRMVRDILPGTGSSRPAGLAAMGSGIFFSAHDGEHGAELWQSDGSAAGTHMVQDIAPGAISSHPRELIAHGGRLFFSADDGVWGRELWSLPLVPSGCVPTTTAMCLGGGRYKVEAHWRDFSGHQGAGTGVALTADTGYFWFFGPENVEVILKVLEGNGVNGHVWVFYGALSTVEYTLTVTDTATGAARRYVNPSGRLGSVADTSAFGPLGATPSTITFGPSAKHQRPAAATWRQSAAGIAPCVAGPTRLCLNGGRFAVEARWSIPGSNGAGQAVALTGDTGYLWFFGADNVELVVKVLDGRPVNGKFWVFYGALSDVDYTLTVTDTATGAVREYHNPAGRLASGADTTAF